MEKIGGPSVRCMGSKVSVVMKSLGTPDIKTTALSIDFYDFNV